MFDFAHGTTQEQLATKLTFADHVPVCGINDNPMADPVATVYYSSDEITLMAFRLYHGAMFNGKRLRIEFNRLYRMYLSRYYVCYIDVLHTVYKKFILSHTDTKAYWS